MGLLGGPTSTLRADKALARERVETLGGSAPEGLPFAPMSDAQAGVGSEWPAAPSSQHTLIPCILYLSGHDLMNPVLLHVLGIEL